MAYTQKDYFLSTKYNQDEQLINTLKYQLQKAKNENRYATWGETIERLINSLESKQFENLEPWDLDTAIFFLLEFVPEEIKNK